MTFIYYLKWLFCIMHGGQIALWGLYSKQHTDFEDIIRHGKLLNDELVKSCLAVKYGD